MRSAKRRILPDDKLVRYSKEHLYYEIEMFFGVGIELSRIHFPPGDKLAIVHRNALLESFVVHLRNLLLFLYPHDPGKEDVVSNDYFLDTVNDWKRARPKETRALVEARNRAHREVAHLTSFRRERGTPQGWPVAELMGALKPILKIFVDNASDKRLDRSLKTLVDSTDLNTIQPALTDTSTKSIAVGGFYAANEPVIVGSKFPC
jgi:hypothetical protein